MRHIALRGVSLVAFAVGLTSCGQEAVFTEDQSRSLRGGGGDEAESADGTKESSETDSKIQGDTLDASIDPEDSANDKDSSVVEDGEAQDDTGEESNDEDPTTKDDVIATCLEATPTVIQSTVEFEARQDCQWGTVQGGMEVLSANGNLSIKQGYIRAREDQTVTIDVPEGAVVCGIGLTSSTDTIHFDDFYALRMDKYVVASSKVLADGLEADEDGHLIWDWPRIRGDGTAATGTLMQDIGKFCGTGACSLPEHDTPGAFAINVELTDDAAQVDPMNAALFAKLSSLDQISITATATGDNDGGDCFHSGGSFDVSLQFVAP